MIKHIVLLDLLSNYSKAELRAIMKGFVTLKAKLHGFTHFEHGPNRDFEGMSPGAPYGFICHFANEDTSRTYIIDPDHHALGQRLGVLCKGGIDGITVIDLELPEAEAA
jgi:hypothetical protein